MDLYTEIHGQGEPVILLHSGGADLRDWQFIVPQLAKTHQVIAFDGRGAGQSPPLLEPANYVEDLKALLDFFGLEQTVLVGHSMGGKIATDFALAYPHRVTKLVLIAPGLSGAQRSPEVAQWFEGVRAAAPDIDKMTHLALDHPVHSVVMASPQRELMIAMIRHNIERSFEWKVFEMQWPEPPAVERLGELTTKTLFIIGTEEMADNMRTAELFQQAPNIQFAWIQGADHSPTLTHPNQVANLITGFLDEHPTLD